MENKSLFENWIVLQMGSNIKSMLANFDIEGGYHDQTINAMWIGFNAGIELSK